MAAKALYSHGLPVKRSKERNRQRQKVCMRERLAVESGTASTSTDRPAAMAIGEARGSRVGVSTRR